MRIQRYLSLTSNKTQKKDNTVNRLFHFIFLLLLSCHWISCSGEQTKGEIIWDHTIKNNYASIYKVEYTKSNLAHEKPWYVMVTVNTPTFISFCNKFVIYPTDGKTSGSKNLFLEASDQSCNLTISIYGKKESLVLNPVVFGSMSDLWQYQFKKDGFLILFGFFYLVIGIFALYVFFLKQSSFQYLAFSTLLLLAGTYSLSIGNELFGMIFPSFPSEYWISALLGSLYLFPGALLWFLSFLLFSKWKKRFRVGGLFYLAIMTAVLMVLSFLDVEFDTIVTPFHLVCIIFLFVFFPPFFLTLRNPKHNLTHVLSGLMIFLFFAFLEMGISYFTKNLEFPLLSFGLFCFLVPLAEFSIREFFRLETQIQNVKEIQNLRKDRSGKTSRSRIANLNEEEVVEKIRYLIETEKIYLDEDLTLRKLAKRLQIREDQASYLINHNFKITFFSLINYHRIEEAKILLKKKETNILNIAYSVGFQSKSAFNSIFKKFTKMTPSEFQKQNSV